MKDLTGYIAIGLMIAAVVFGILYGASWLIENVSTTSFMLVVALSIGILVTTMGYLSSLGEE